MNPIKQVFAIIFMLLLIAPVAVYAAGSDSGGSSGGSSATSTDSRKIRADAKRTEAVKLIKAEQYAKASDLLKDAVKANPEDANAWNWLGYTYRKQHKYEDAQKNYREALRLDPNHKGAHEYLGELYVEIGELNKAEEMRDNLAKICNGSCEELNDLNEFIAKNKKN